MSARWQNRKFQPSFPYRNINLTMIFGPKCLYENSRIQLISYKHKAENSYIKMGKKSNSTLLTPAPPPCQHSLVPGENALAHNFSLEGKEKSGVCIQNSGFLEGCLGDWFLYKFIWNTNGVSIIWIPGDCWERRVGCNLLQPVQFSAIRSKSITWGFFLGRWEEDRNMCLEFWLFRRLLKGLVSVFPDSGHWQGASILWMPGGCWAGLLAALEPENMQYHR